MRNETTELEVIMREALLQFGLFFDEQVYARTETGLYIFDFLVYGDFSKVIVECDGPLHYNQERWFLDSRRDLWSIQNGYQDVLRFETRKIRNAIGDCIEEIRTSIQKYDHALAHDVDQGARIAHEREGIKQKKHSPFYEGEREGSRWSGIKVKINPEKPDPFFIYEDSQEEVSMPACPPSMTLPSHDEKSPHRHVQQTIRTQPTKKVAIEHGLVIPETELVWWKMMKTLSKEQKTILWHLIKSSNKDGLSIYAGHPTSVQRMIEMELLAVHLNKTKAFLILAVLSKAPVLLRALQRL